MIRVGIVRDRNMITALDAKMIAYTSRPYSGLVLSKIINAAKSGDLTCAISMEEIPDGTTGKLYEMSRFLNDFGYHTMIEQNTLVINWIPNWNYVDESNIEEE